MKIISKFKDFYDYLQGIYGIDEKIVLDRTSSIKMNYYHNYNHFKIYFCGYVIEGVCINNEFLYGDELEKYNHINTKPSKDCWYILNDLSRLISVRKYPYMDKKLTNEKYNCPIIYSRLNCTNSEEYMTNYPILKDLNFHKVYTAEQVFLMLSEWIAREKPIINNQTDKEKIVSAGFDLKTSFRNV